MNKLKLFFLISFIFIVLIIEGLNLPMGHQASFYLISLLWIPLLFKEKKLLNNIKTVKIAVFFIFIFFSIISIFLSTDPWKSAPFLSYYISLLAVFLFVKLHKKTLAPHIKRLILLLSTSFILSSLFITLYKISGEAILLPKHGFQFIYARFGHNHLGDFLLIPLLMFLYEYVTTKKKINLIYLLLFLPFFIFSYSRSAYLSFFIPSVLFALSYLRGKGRNISKKLVLLILTINVTLVLFFFLTVVEARHMPFLNQVHDFLSVNFNLKDKNFYGGRIYYIDQALSSINDKPWFGIGPGNFPYASKKYTETKYTTTSSHNIFLDILTENGLFAGIAFTLFILICFYKSNKTSAYFYISLALLLNFQTDYTFTIHGFYLLFFVFLGMAV